MDKVLFVSHLANFVKFNKAFMKWFQEQGWEVHYASLDEEEIPFCDKHFKVDFNRSPYSLNNIRAYRQLKAIIDREDYSIIHCHTPMGGVVTRLAARAARKRGAKVLYTAHGFHFYKGAPLINWLLYYTVEKYLARYTDCLITLNEEDYQAAITRKFRAGSIKKIDGVGVNLNRFHPISEIEKLALRKSFGFSNEDYILVCVAEFIPRKNHEYLLKQLPNLTQKIPSLKVVFAGQGVLFEDCKELAKKLNVIDQCAFLGYRQDIDKILSISDILVSTSKQEGLPINVIEGMAIGLPIVCTAIRGHVDVIENGRNGFLFTYQDEKFSEHILQLYNNKQLSTMFSKSNLIDVKKYSVEYSVEAMADIYVAYMGKSKQEQLR